MWCRWRKGFIYLLMVAVYSSCFVIFLSRYSSLKRDARPNGITSLKIDDATTSKATTQTSSKALPSTGQLRLVNVTVSSSTKKLVRLTKSPFPLTDRLQAPQLDHVVGKLRKSLDVIIGITTVKRAKIDYVYDTVKSLQENLGSRKSACAIVVCIGETEEEKILEITSKLKSQFSEQIQSGQLQIISPPKDYYPEWDQVLTQNFGDKIERVKWRSKQNLDQIFLMTYVYHLSPSYYLMMEDDIIATPAFMDKILSEAEKRQNDDWFFLSFSELGAIGKLFRTRVLPTYVSFIRLFWNKKPIDWLQDDFVSSAYCSFDESSKRCNERKKDKMVQIRPSLFQHVGKFSSLNGKVQNRKDKYFPTDKPQG